ncbi:hypothetical protein TUM16653_18760 [Enterobacter cloacae]|nr:hypothetical protein SL264_16860 [Enterobacter cloacae]GJJ88390.1 hypothetical protein TUM16653_18760 [Enterobacter cloacae]
MHVTKKIVQHSLIGHAEHHNGIIAEGVGITAYNMRLWTSVYRLHGKQKCGGRKRGG